MFRLGEVFYGPTFKAFAALDTEGQARLHADVSELIARHDQAERALEVPAEYLEVVIER